MINSIQINKASSFTEVQPERLDLHLLHPALVSMRISDSLPEHI